MEPAIDEPYLATNISLVQAFRYGVNTPYHRRRKAEVESGGGPESGRFVQAA
jgi:hypothetical protein